MADEKDTEKQTNLEQEKGGEKTDETAKAKGPGVPLLTWTILAVVVVFSAGAGFALGRLLAASRKSARAESSMQNESAQSDEPQPDHSTRSEKVWFYDLEPVVANLDVPGVTRYVRATLTLAMSSHLDQKEGTALLEKKKRLLTNWLTIYLASLTLEDTRGDRNLRRIQSQILDAFNEKLFPDVKPQVDNILFKEFAVQ